MAQKKSDVKFKYVNTIPNNVKEGTFYWKYENRANQLYFSPTDNKDDMLRLDNIISGGGNALMYANGIALVGIYDTPEETTIIDQSGTVSAWSDDDWENYVKNFTEEEKYGNLSELPFSAGNVVICGNREFICKQSDLVYKTTKIDGVTYYFSKIEGVGPCVDRYGNFIRIDSEEIPEDAAVERYNILEWECFGENLSKDLAEKIADFNMEIYGSATILVDEQEGGIYTLSVRLKEYNPLKLNENKNGVDEVGLRFPDTDNGDQILMSANQIKDVMNEIIPRWRETI